MAEKFRLSSIFIYMNEVLKYIDQRLSEYDAAEKKAQKELSRLSSENHLRVGKSNGYWQYYLLSAGGNQLGRYIPAGRRDVARKLAQRDYAMQVSACIARWRPKLQVARKLLAQTSRICDIPVVLDISAGRQVLIQPYSMTDADYAVWWQSQSYMQKPIKPGTVTHNTNRGEKVRSKSEKIIADWLFAHHLPYRYEQQLLLPGYGQCYPDFTILNVHTRQPVYLEHLGMLGDDTYAQGAVLRFNAFMRAGCQLGNTFFCTLESNTVPLDSALLGNLLAPLL